MSAKKRQPPKKRLKLGGEYGPDNDTLQSLLHEGGVSKSALARMLNKLEGVDRLTRIIARIRSCLRKCAMSRRARQSTAACSIGNFAILVSRWCC